MNRETAMFYYLLLKKHSDKLSPEKIKEIKTAIRNDARRQANSDKITVVKSYGIDGYIEKIEIPETIRTQEEAINYFNTKYRRTWKPSQYDCTGQANTIMAKVAKQGNRFYIYHQIIFDV